LWCLNSIFFFNFFFNFFKLPQFIFFFKNINYGNFKKGILFKYNNVFLSYKFFICADVGDSVLYKKGLSLQFRQFNNFFFLFSELFIKREYAKYLNCFYFLFFNKIPFLFFSLQDFFFEFIDFFLYIYDYKIYNLYKSFFLFTRNKVNRTRAKFIFKKLYAYLNIKVTVVFDAKFSAYYYEMLLQSNTLLIGFEHGSHRKPLYHYSIFLINHHIFYKFFLFNSMVDIHTIALYNYSLLLCNQFLFKYKLLI